MAQVTLSEEIGAAGGKELSSKAQARRLAFYLFWNVKADFSRSFIVREDLEHFMPARKAAKAFALLDGDNDGKVLVVDVHCKINIYLTSHNKFMSEPAQQ